MANPASDDLVAEIEAGLEGVTPGPWEVGADDQHGQSVVRSQHIELFTGWHHSVGAIEQEMRANAAHIARCSPDNIAALLARIEAEKAGREKVEAELAEARSEHQTYVGKLTTAEAARDRLAADLAEARKPDVLIAALEFYANPAVYAPHPHGPAFDRRDISFKAKNALAEFRGNDELPPNFAACCNSTDLAACDCVEKMHIRVLFSRGGKRKYQPIGDPL